MIIEAARLTAERLFSEPFRAVLWKSLGLTLAVLAGLWFGLKALFVALALPFLAGFLPTLPAWAGFLGTIAAVAAGLGLALALALLIAPVTAIVAGMFIDDVAEVVERVDYPADAPGKALPVLRATILSIRFLGVVIAGNIVAMLLLFVPGINLAAFFLVNGYLLGRGYFEFAAMRFRDEEDALRMRRKHSATVFMAGLVIAGFLAVPFLNLLTPLFAAAMMVHLHKMIAERDPDFAAAAVASA